MTYPPGVDKLRGSLPAGGVEVVAKCETKGCPFPATWRYRDINADVFICFKCARFYDQEQDLSFDRPIKRIFDEHVNRAPRRQSAYVPTTNEEGVRRWDGFHQAHLSSDTHKIGRPFLELEDISISVLFYASSGLSARKIIPFLNSLHRQGVLTKVPHYNSLIRYRRDQAIIQEASKFMSIFKASSNWLTELASVTSEIHSKEREVQALLGGIEKLKKRASDLRKHLVTIKGPA